MFLHHFVDSLVHFGSGVKPVRRAVAHVQFVVPANLSFEEWRFCPSFPDSKTRQFRQITEVIFIGHHAQVDGNVVFKTSVNAFNNSVEGGLSAFQVTTAVVNSFCAIQRNLHFADESGFEEFHIRCERVTIGYKCQIKAGFVCFLNKVFDYFALIIARKQRFASKNGDVFFPSGKFGTDVIEKSIDHFGGQFAFRRAVTFLIAIGTGKVTGIIRYEKQLNFIFIPIVKKIQVGHFEGFCFFLFVNQVLPVCKVSFLIVLIMKHFQFMSRNNIGTSVKRIYNEKIITVGNCCDNIVFGCSPKL